METCRAGVDMRGKLNLGFDLNSRQGKINVFASVHYNQRKSEMTGVTDRYNLVGSPFGTHLTNVFQNDAPVSDGYFAFVRGGFDWFLDNRNTVTISGTFPTGAFSPTDILHEQTDTIGSGRPLSTQEYSNYLKAFQ